MAYLLWQRRSRNPENLLKVALADPQDNRSSFVVIRQGKASPPMKTPSQVQRYIRNFYEALLYSDGNAPNDVFLDSMNSVTKRRSET